MHDNKMVCLLKYIIIAYELRAWLLHYSPVVLKGVLMEEYYQHYLLLIEGIYLLLKDVVRKDDITQSIRLLCYIFPALYDGKLAVMKLPVVIIFIEQRYMTLNVHGLLHLPQVVENLGPQWAHSCFPFETACLSSFMVL